jgi:hypothetical protein
MQSAVPLPGGVADPEGHTGYVVGASGHLEALELATGRLLWSVAGAGEPLLVLGKRLITRLNLPPNRLRLVVLDVANRGHRLLESEVVIFPEWVSIEDPNSFGLEAFGLRETVHLTWHASARYQGGAPPPQSVAAKAKKSEAGEVLVDLKTGRVEMRGLGETPGQEQFGAVANRRSYPYERGGLPEAAPLVAGGKLATLDLKEAEGRQALYIDRWDLATGRSEESIALPGGADLRPQVTLDGRFLLVQEERSSGHYAVISLETGRQIASGLPLDPGRQVVAVLGSRLYSSVESPRADRAPVQTVSRTLRAIDLASGKVVWERPLMGRSVTPKPTRRP